MRLLVVVAIKVADETNKFGFLKKNLGIRNFLFIIYKTETKHFKGQGKLTYTFSANANVLSVSAT